MSAPGFKIGDKVKGVSLKFDSTAGELTATYAPNRGTSEFQATLHVTDTKLLQRMEELCEGAAMASGARDEIVEVRLSELTPRADYVLRATDLIASSALEWLLYSNENTNWTYDLTPRSLSHLANMVSIATKRPVDEIEAFITELKTDEDLKTHIAKTILDGPADRAGLADTIPRWSRRVGWYAVVRALKPKLLIETGVDKGLGSVLLCAALARNSTEGHEGRYIGTDINPSAGYLLCGPYLRFGEIRYGDSIETLQSITDPVDVFINDSDHNADYEYREYQTLAPLMHDSSVILGDNAHSTDMLMRFAAETDRKFLFFREPPQGHWYPGAGVGFAFT